MLTQATAFVNTNLRQMYCIFVCILTVSSSMVPLNSIPPATRHYPLTYFPIIAKLIRRKGIPVREWSQSVKTGERVSDMILLELSDTDRWAVLRDYFKMIWPMLQPKWETAKESTASEVLPVLQWLSFNKDDWIKWCKENNHFAASEYCKKLFDNLKDMLFGSDCCEQMLFLLLCADYDTLTAVIDWMMSTGPYQYASPKVCSNDYSKLNTKELQSALFDYEHFRNRVSFKAFLLRFYTDMLNVTVCPYCNRNWISSVPGVVKNHNNEENKDPLITSQTDHYFPKELYPYLALSLFNFVPSCNTCNNHKSHFDTFSGTDWKWYPYEQKHCGSASFCLNIENYLELSSLAFAPMQPVYKKGGTSDLITISTSSDDPKRILMLERLYRSHAAEIQEIIFRTLEYTNAWWELMNDIELLPELKEEHERFLQQQRTFLLQGDDWKKRLQRTPLGKLKHDIAEDLLPRSATDPKEIGGI